MADRENAGLPEQTPDLSPADPVSQGPGRLRRLHFVAVGAALVLGVMAGLTELALRFFVPQVVLFPRWDHSRQYGFVLPPGARMVHQLPGRWRFDYTINELGCRGEPVPVSNRYRKMNIVVLGDSFAMGQGVNDGEEFPALLGQQLKDRFDVVNTGVAGWGLTQQVRRYYEFGQLYQPKVVILQFCVNDPFDNLLHRVTRVKDGRFVFVNTGRSDSAFTRFLSRSRWIQNSQVYSFLRASYSRLVDEPPSFEPNREVRSPDSPPLHQRDRVYNELLEPLAEDLARRGVTLLMIAVNGHLTRHPHIQKKVQDLDRRGLLAYLEVEPWFRGVEDDKSPEGHNWGIKGHRIIAEHLSAEINRRFPR